MSSINGHNGFHIGNIHVPPQKVRTPAPSHIETNEAPEQTEVFSPTGLTHAPSQPAATESFAPQAAAPQSSAAAAPTLNFSHQTHSSSPKLLGESSQVQGIDLNRPDQLAEAKSFTNSIYSTDLFSISDTKLTKNALGF